MQTRVVLSLSLVLCATADVAPGTLVQTWSCGGANERQNWTLLPADGGGVFTALPGGAVLSIPGLSNKSATQLNVAVADHAAPLGQTWQLDGGVLRSTLHGLCAAATDPIPGVAVELQPCNASDPLQLWVHNATTGSFSLAAATNGGPLGPACLDAGSAINCTSGPYAAALFCNATAAPAARAADVARRLTVYDLRNLLGGWYATPGIPRLGVPRFSFAEALHGLGTGCGHAFSNASYTTTGCPTSFPHATLLAAGFNRSLWQAVGAVISAEARAVHGGLMLYTPDINLSRDQRWGRAQEVPGEDPLLTSEYAAAFVAGLQQQMPGLPLRAAATCKHWTAYDYEGRSGADDPSPTNITRHNFDANVSRKDLAEYFTPPFKACVQRGGAVSVMSALEAINGVPCAANSNLTFRLLHEQWGFGGFVTSDCGAVSDIQYTHDYVATPPEAVAAAVLGGTDWNCGHYYQDDMAASLAEGLVTLAELQAAAARFLAVPFALGLVDAVDPWESWGYERVDTPASRALALEAAEQGIVLLKNAPAAAAAAAGPGPRSGRLVGARPILPLNLSALKTIAVVGPHGNASVAMQSNYFGRMPLVESNTPLLRLLARTDRAGVAVTFAPGVPTADSNDTSGVAAAVAAAAAADVTLAFLGLDQALEREGLDRDYLGLPPAQAALLAGLSALGRPLVVVLLQGGAVSLDGTGCDALVAAFYPGELGGEAVAAVLLGEVAPAGRLPVTVYNATWADRRAPTDMQLAPHPGSSSSSGGGELGGGPADVAVVPGATYWYVDAADVLFPFGFSLSYSAWTVAWAAASGANVSVDAADWAAGRAVPAFNATVCNTGLVASGAVTLGFIASNVPGEPSTKLFDFARLPVLGPGECGGVSLAVPATVAALVSLEGAHILTPGLYQVQLGGDAAGGGPAILGSLTVTGSPVVLESLPW